MVERAGPAEQVRGFYAEAETAAARASEQLVRGDSFGELLARLTENTMALTRIGFGTLDLLVRNLRIAGRTDLVRLGRQLARNEDKLEMVLREVEKLQDQVARLERPQPPGRGRAGASSAAAGSDARRARNGTGRRKAGGVTSSPDAGRK
ncbi:MAG: hypothetical protein NVSMB25_05900 [Thermoleophilaceae bacterium]